VDEAAAAGGAQAPAAPYSKRHRRRSVRLSESMPNPAAEPQFLVVLLRPTLRGLRPIAAPGRWPPPQRHATARRAAWPPHSLAEPSPPAARTEAAFPSHTAAGRQSELRYACMLFDEMSGRTKHALGLQLVL
jgi:hypothetical protein